MQVVESFLDGLMEFLESLLFQMLSFSLVKKSRDPALCRIDIHSSRVCGSGPARGDRDV